MTDKLWKSYILQWKDLPKKLFFVQILGSEAGLFFHKMIQELWFNPECEVFVTRPISTIVIHSLL